MSIGGTASLSGVSQGGNYVGTAEGTAGTPAFTNASMIVSMSGYVASGMGSSVITVGLEASNDGTNWALVGTVNYGAGPNWVAAFCPGCQLRAVILNWGAAVTAGSVTATVTGV